MWVSRTGTQFDVGFRDRKRPVQVSGTGGSVGFGDREPRRVRIWGSGHGRHRTESSQLALSPVPKTYTSALRRRSGSFPVPKAYIFAASAAKRTPFRSRKPTFLPPPTLPTVLPVPETNVRVPQTYTPPVPETDNAFQSLKQTKGANCALVLLTH